MTDVDPRNIERDAAILDAAVSLSREQGYRNVTRAQVAAAARLSAASVSNYGRRRITNGDHPRGERVMERIREDVMRRGVDEGDLVLIAQGLADRHPAALAAPDQLRIAALSA